MKEESKKQSKDDQFDRFFNELSKVRDNQRSLVLITHGFLELLVETLIRAKCKNAKRITDDQRSFSYAAKLLLLNEIGVIPDWRYQLFDSFRKVRNRAAHEAFFEVSDDEIERLAAKTDSEPTDLYELCVVTFASLWNNHIDEFGPVFAPVLTQSNDT